MGKVFDGIDDRMAAWIAVQPLFFVGTAPLDRDGHVNVSPKGPIGTLRILDPHTVAYLDLTGSGAETAAHARENSRIVIMLCAFQGPPKVVRLHGRAEIIPAVDHRFQQLLNRCGFSQPEVPQLQRAVILVDVQRVSTSCGYGVPLMSLEGLRPQMDLWGEKKIRSGGPDGLRDYQREKNSTSIDGLPAIETELSAGAAQGAD